MRIARNEEMTLHVIAPESDSSGSVVAWNLAGRYFTALSTEFDFLLGFLRTVQYSQLSTLEYRQLHLCTPFDLKLPVWESY